MALPHTHTHTHTPPRPRMFNKVPKAGWRSAACPRPSSWAPRAATPTPAPPRGDAAGAPSTSTSTTPPTGPQWALPTLTYHEAAPGHLFQGAILQEAGALAPALQEHQLHPAYAEGWGLYAEQPRRRAGHVRSPSRRPDRAASNPSSIGPRGSCSTPASTPRAGAARSGHRLHDRDRWPAPGRGRERDRPLRGLAGPGLRLQDRPHRDRQAAHQGQGRARHRSST